MLSAVFLRRVHKWVAVVIALPLVITLVTGVLLILRQQLSWVQPKTVKIAEPELSIGWDEIFEVAKTVPEAKITSLTDISRIQASPSSGLIRVRSRNSDWEIQINGKTGEVLKAASRRTTFLIRLHEGSLFGQGVKLGVFLPMSIGVLVLWFTGMYIFFHAVNRKRRRNSTRAKGLAEEKK